MKILMVTPIFYPSLGGMEKVIENLALKLQEMGHEVCIAVFGMSRRNRLARTTISGLPVVNYFCHGSRLFPLSLDDLREWRDFDIVHLHDNQFGLITLNIFFRLRRIPTIATTHGLFLHTQKFRWIKPLYAKLLAAPVARRVNRVVACSFSDKTSVEQWGVPCSLIENGIDGDAFKTTGARKKEPTFLYWGRLSENKRVQTLLETFEQVIETLPGARLTIIGADTENRKKGYLDFVKRQGLEKQIRILDALPQDSLREEIQKHSFFVSATAYEGFGLSLVEAMAGGLIPIANDIPPFRSIMNQPNNGFLINYDAPLEAAKQIVQTFTSMNDTTYQAHLVAIQDRAESFSWTIKAKEYEAVYRDVLDASQTFPQQNTSAAPCV